MDAENAGVQASTGRRFCRACKRAYRRARRRGRARRLCRRGLHDLTVEGNVYTRPDGRQRACRPCRVEADRRRRQDRAAELRARAEAEGERRALAAALAAGPYGSPTHARARLALIVRSSRGA